MDDHSELRKQQARQRLLVLMQEAYDLVANLTTRYFETRDNPKEEERVKRILTKAQQRFVRRERPLQQEMREVDRLARKLTSKSVRYN
jgi:hypothetical protein